MIWVRSKYEYSQTLAVMALDEDGSLYGVATVYLEGQSEKLPECCAFVDTNNWPDVDKLLIDEDIAVLEETVGQSGFCTYPAMRFDLDKIKEV